MSHSAIGDKLTPREARARAKRDQIRAGAQRLFLERGFAATSTDAIASEAGVSKQTLYAYYPCKDELLADVLRHLIGEGLREQAPEAAEERSRVECHEELRRRLLELANGILASIMQPNYLSLIRVIVAETPRLPHLGDLFRQAVAERAMESVSVLLKRAREEGVAEVEDLDAASRMLVGPLLTYAVLDGLLVAEGSPCRPAPERIEAIVKLYAKAIS